ncbi:MAG: squalene/phytoene synthase family protein [Gorillibacterium sp.]|nr:squalene/phytoene synthase family protein [Gorillibacterium sp.]
MKPDNNNYQEAIEVLMKTSRTFSIPLRLLQPGLQEIAVSAYLCMRALDEIEDHPVLSNQEKSKVLRQIGALLQNPFTPADIKAILFPYQSVLPDVTLRLSDWIFLYPSSFSARLWEITAHMAEEMAGWAERNWVVETVEDLDHYTYSVAGMVGILLSDLWKWYANVQTDHIKAVAFGRGLQAVNIIRNQGEDLERGVHFYPNGWGLPEMITYAKRNLALGKAYVDSIDPGPIHNFCSIPLALANATIETIASGKPKLTRENVRAIVRQVVPEMG